MNSVHWWKNSVNGQPFFLVTLSIYLYFRNLFFGQLCDCCVSIGGLVENPSATWVVQQSVTKIITLTYVNLVTLKPELSMSFCSTNRPHVVKTSQLMFQDKFDLSCSFKCDQIWKTQKDQWYFNCLGWYSQLLISFFKKSGGGGALNWECSGLLSKPFVFSAPPPFVFLHDILISQMCECVTLH